MTTDTTYNGWKNKETWLVNIWYMDEMPTYFAEMEQYHVDANELEDAVKYIAEECEALSQLPAGLLSDFISTCWGEVDWHSLAEHLNDDLKEMQDYYEAMNSTCDRMLMDISEEEGEDL